MIRDGRRYYFSTNHIGTPLEVLNDSAETVWSGDYSAYGRCRVRKDAKIENNIRFPGQYLDEETGLHYNLFRYYDPDTGRYISIDPIGFASGDLNLCRYAGNNPMNQIDPLGLLCDEDRAKKYGTISAPPDQSIWADLWDKLYSDYRKFMNPDVFQRADIVSEYSFYGMSTALTGYGSFIEARLSYYLFGPTIIQAAGDFAVSALPGVPTVNWSGAGGVIFGKVFDTGNWF